MSFVVEERLLKGRGRRLSFVTVNTPRREGRWRNETRLAANHDIAITAYLLSSH
jgi:hypothetical protein